MNTAVTRRHVFLIALYLWLLLLVAFLVPGMPGAARAVLALPCLLLVPGMFIALALQIRARQPWEWWAYSIGLSIVFLIVAGLLVNTLRVVGVARPFSPVVLSNALLALLVPLALVAYRRSTSFVLEMRLRSWNWRSQVVTGFAATAVLLAIIGAHLVNRGFSGWVSVSAYFVVALCVVLVAAWHEQLEESSVLTTIFLSACAILLAGWLRSFYVSGADVNLEYRLFLLVRDQGYWSMELFRHAYTACLSVTILPIILSTFIQGNDMLLFKMVFPVLFALSPVGVYLIARRYFSKSIAYFTAVFFIAQPAFVLWMQIPARQQIALLLFTFCVLALLSTELREWQRLVLVSLFGAGVVLTHYSSSYIMFGMFVSAYMLSVVYRWLLRRGYIDRYGTFLFFTPRTPEPKPSHNRQLLTPWMLLVLFLVGVFWLGPATGAGYNLVRTGGEVINNMHELFTTPLRAERDAPWQQFNIFYSPKHDSLLRDYESEIATLRAARNPAVVYDGSAVSSYVPRLRNSRPIPPRIDASVSNATFLIGELLKKIWKGVVIIGTLALLWLLPKRKIPVEYAMLVLSSIGLLFLIMLLPFLTIEYDLLRAYQQVLVVAAIGAPVGMGFLLTLGSERARRWTTAVLLIAYFLLIGGVVNQVVGGQPPAMQFENFGTQYAEFYTHRGEIFSGQWLSREYIRGTPLYAGLRAQSKFSLTNTVIRDDYIPSQVFPATLERHAFVYVSRTNLHEQRDFVSFRGEIISTSYPIEFLRAEKNKLYANRDSEVYK